MSLQVRMLSQQRDDASPRSLNIDTCPQLTLVQENLKYYLELRQHQKSDTLEWVSEHARWTRKEAAFDCAAHVIASGSSSGACDSSDA